MTDDELKNLINDLHGKIRVTKITATRSIRGNNGQTFAGFTARSDSLEDESGGDAHDEVIQDGHTMRDARLTYYLLAMQADLASINAAWAGGGIPASVRDEMIRSTKRNYTMLLRNAAKGDGETNE